MKNFLTGIRKIEYASPSQAGILEMPYKNGKVARVGGTFTAIRILDNGALSQGYDTQTRIYDVELTFSVLFLTTPSALKYADKVYRLTDVHGNEYLMGGRHTPYPQASIEDSLPDNASSPRKTTVTVTLASLDGIIPIV